MEGRSRGGGLRFGEMERDAIIGHGCSSVLRDRLFINSDKYSLPVCTKCGLFGIPASGKKFGNSIYKKMRCHNCDNSDCIQLDIPYASKLCIQELLGLHIATRLRIKNA